MSFYDVVKEGLEYYLKDKNMKCKKCGGSECEENRCRSERYNPNNIQHYSNCCHAFMGPYYEDTLICPECKEHCGKTKECEDCFGEGYATLFNGIEQNSCKCGNCKGEGFIDVL